jgi:hypothetical protein
MTPFIWSQIVFFLGGAFFSLIHVKTKKEFHNFLHIIVEGKRIE